MGKRVYKKCISIFLVVCMLVSITPASTCQVKAAGSINIMDITEILLRKREYLSAVE